jgi:hypothetical protein
LLASIETARQRQPQDHLGERMVVSFVGMGISTIVGRLGLAVKKFPKDEKRVRWELQPWIVEAALKRLGSRQLSREEQREVWDNARTPENVRWPEWWEVKG